jgi:hypothetical protein
MYRYRCMCKIGEGGEGDNPGGLITSPNSNDDDDIDDDNNGDDYYDDDDDNDAELQTLIQADL